MSDIQRCPKCGSEDICQQTEGPERYPWGCLDCDHEFQHPIGEHEISQEAGPAGTSPPPALIINEQVVELTTGMYGALCGLVHGTEAIDQDTVTASDEDWAALRSLFPLADAHTVADEVSTS